MNLQPAIPTLHQEDETYYEGSQYYLSTIESLRSRLPLVTRQAVVIIMLVVLLLLLFWLAVKNGGLKLKQVAVTLRWQKELAYAMPFVLICAFGAAYMTWNQEADLDIHSLTTSETIKISLVPGWNLVSIPLQPENNEISQVLDSIEGSYDLVYAYSGCDTVDPWKKYDPSAPPFANDLTQIDQTMALWIQMTATETFEVSGTAPSTTSIPLCSGWNLMDYSSSQHQAIADALISIDGVYTLVYTYNAADTADPWKKYDPSAPPFANDLLEMQPELGYWINVSQNIEWRINNVSRQSES